MEKLRVTILVLFIFSIINPYNPLLSQQFKSFNLDALINKVDETFRERNQSQLEVIERIVKSFYEAFPQDNKFIDCLYSIDCNIEYQSILNYKNQKPSASIQPDQTVTITTALLMRLLDNAVFCTKILASYYTGIPANEISDDAIINYRFDTQSTILAWVIAHEIAHAYLGHNHSGNECFKPANLEKSRLCELEADLFSFDILNRAGYSLVILLSYFDMIKRLEDIQNEMGKGREETNSSHPNFNTRYLVLLSYILSSKTFYSPIFIFSTFIQGNTRDLPSKMSFVLVNKSYCHTGFIVENDQLTQVAFEFMSDSSALVYYKNDIDYMHWRVSNIYAHECDLQITGHYENSNIDGTYKVYRDSYKGTLVLFDSDLINNMINIEKESFYMKVLLKYTQNERAIYTATKSLINIYATFQDLFLQYQKGEISLTIFTERHNQAKQSLIRDLQSFFSEDQIISILAAIGVF